MRRTRLGSCVSKNHREIEERPGHLFHLLGNMTAKSALFVIFLELSVSMICASRGEAQSVTPSTENQAWPEADAHVQLPSNWRVLSFVGLEQAAGYPFQQWYAAGALGYQFKPILREHIFNIDPDKEHYLVFGGGYEYLRTSQSGVVKHENRITIDVTPGFLLPAKILVRDRSWVELRWIDGTYSTTYRNMVAIERGLFVHGLRFSPFGSAEVFYDSPKHSWNEEWYTAGIQWPYKSLFMVETYYKREHCDTCSPTNWNVGGVTLHFYLRSSK